MTGSASTTWKHGARILLRSLLLLPLCGCICTSGEGRAAGEPAAPPGPAAPAQAVSMRVLWTVSGYRQGKGSQWSEREAASFLFKPLDMTQSEITFDGRSCKGVRFQREQVAAARYLPLAWRVTPQELGLADREVEVVRTDCTLPGFQEYLRLSGNRLLIQVNGLFLFFDPVLMR